MKKLSKLFLLVGFAAFLAMSCDNGSADNGGGTGGGDQPVDGEIVQSTNGEIIVTPKATGLFVKLDYRFACRDDNTLIFRGRFFLPSQNPPLRLFR